MKTYTFQNSLVGKKQLKEILSWTFTNYGSVQASLLADELKYLGFHFATKAGISISLEDLRVPPVKKLILENSNEEIKKTETTYLNGKITQVERFQTVIDTWNTTSEILKKELVSFFQNHDPLNPVYMMAFSGARGNFEQVRQLIAMRGLMSDPNGEIMDLPIKQNFREGLSTTDYLMSGYGARKGVVDTALKTANSGYLTRRLIDVSQDILIREKDCLTNRAIIFKNPKKINSSLLNRILGRVTLNDIVNASGEVLIKEGTCLTPKLVKKLVDSNNLTIEIRSPLVCQLHKSVCQKCYGWNLANENLVDLGDAIGIVAGQSIGEPGTQLTMRTFHTGGIFTAGVNEQILSPENGFLKFSELLRTVSFRTNRGENVLKTENSGSLLIIPDKGDTIKIEIPVNTRIFQQDGSRITKDTLLAQCVETNKQTKIETQLVHSQHSGEIQIQTKKSGLKDDKLVEVLRGKIFETQENSFRNFKIGSKVLKNSYISRIKLINQSPGIIQYSKTGNSIDSQNIEILYNNTCIENGKIEPLTESKTNSILFNLNNSTFSLNKLNFQNKNLIKIDLKGQHSFGKLITNEFLTVTGGTPYYMDNNHTIAWLNEETHVINRAINILNVENTQYITSKQEITRDSFSKISGLVQIKEENNIVQEIRIKPGTVHTVRNFDDFDKKIFYPGETLFDNLEINQVSLSEIIETPLGVKVLIRPITLYRIPGKKEYLLETKQTNNLFKFKHELIKNVINGQIYKDNRSVELITQYLNIDYSGVKKSNDTFSVLAKITPSKMLELFTAEKLILTNYLPNDLKTSNLKITLLVHDNQFVNSGTVLGYIENVTPNILDVIKIKVKNNRLFCIRACDCVVVPNEEELVGSIIKGTEGRRIIQKTEKYFFPSNTILFCNTGDLIKDSQIIGELKFEKEITGDIVQGLPKVDQILEARKISTNSENSLVIQSSLNPNFRFLKIGTSLQGEGRVNLHTLLNVYFNYYIKNYTLYESTYRSIKKVQGLILNFIQDVYQSQSVNISDKHLEVIIKQMTTKVKVFHEGDTPLLGNEIINLKQMKYINEAMRNENKKPAYYQPVLMGITKASLSTESFVSSASFQETTRVLSKAAIEGKIDWLRGLKENVIIGRLIPAGTGFNHYLHALEY